MTPLWFWQDEWDGDWLFADQKCHYLFRYNGNVWLDGKLVEIRKEKEGK